MKNIISSFLVAMLCLVSCFVDEGAAQQEMAASKPYRIGVIIALSGPVANLGGYLKKSIDLAYQSLPPEKARLIEVAYEDDQFQPAKTISAYQKLVSAGGVDAAFVLGTSPGHAVAPIAEKDGRILISIGASDGKVAAGRKFVFVHWVTPEEEGKVMVNEIRRRGYKRVGFITAEHEGALAVLNAVQAAMHAEGLAELIVLDEKYVQGETDYRTYIVKARAKDVDAISICLFPGAISSFTRKARESGIKADFMGVELFEDSSEVKAAQGTLDNQWYINADTASPAFEEAYRAKYAEQPGWGSANAYDALNLIAEAVSKFGHDNAKVAEYLRTLKDYHGAAGVYSAASGNRFSLPATVKVVRGDRFEKLAP